MESEQVIVLEEGLKQGHEVVELVDEIGKVEFFLQVDWGSYLMAGCCH